MLIASLIALAALTLLSARLWLQRIQARREAWIRHFKLPPGLFERLRHRHPQLTRKDCELVAHGLRQFFLAHLKSGRDAVSMPSQVVDDLWHEFILYTRHYQQFCAHAFGRFLHHTPAVVLQGGARAANAGLRRCWWQVCREENIDPRRPSRLPLLFALDAKLAIPGGFHYLPDCGGVRRRGEDGGAAYCGGDFASDHVDGGTEGLGDGGGPHGPGGGDGDGGGDGGGGCGGGGD